MLLMTLWSVQLMLLVDRDLLPHPIVQLAVFL